MTSKLTITDERVISVIERLEHYACNLKWTNVRGAQDLLTAADGLRELQERRKTTMDSEPAMESEQLALENLRSAMEGIGHIRRTLEETFGGLHGTHVEPDVLAECKAICDAIYAAYRHAQPAPVVPDALIKAVDFYEQVKRENPPIETGAWKDAVDWVLKEACRAAVLQAGNCREYSNSSTNNCREIAETSTNRSREHFISLCNEFWNWSEMDLVCADDRSYELRMEWDGKVFNHPVTQALWRMYQVAPGNSPVIPGGLIGAVNRLLDSDGSRGCYSAIRCGDAHDEIERLLAAVPQEVKP